MKKLFCLSILLLSLQFYSQTNIFPNDGNAGIGTLTPSEKLEVIGTVKAKTGIFENSLPNGQFFLSTEHRNLLSRSLGLGAVVNTSSQGRTFNFYDFPSSNIDANPTVTLWINDRTAKSRLAFYAASGGSGMFRLFDKSGNINFTVNDDGSNNIHLKLPKINSYVTIGTDSYSDGSELYMLSVNGSIRAERVKVYTDWADFVFESDYILPTLKEVEDFIKLNGHLKDIPSAKEVEENGIELGEMNKLLLLKIEELTLYLIEKDKQYNELKKEFDEIKKHIQSSNR